MQELRFPQADGVPLVLKVQLRQTVATGQSWAAPANTANATRYCTAYVYGFTSRSPASLAAVAATAAAAAAAVMLITAERLPEDFRPASLSDASIQCHQASTNLLSHADTSMHGIQQPVDKETPLL